MEYDSRIALVVNMLRPFKREQIQQNRSHFRFHVKNDRGEQVDVCKTATRLGELITWVKDHDINHPHPPHGNKVKAGMVVIVDHLQKNWHAKYRSYLFSWGIIEIHLILLLPCTLAWTEIATYVSRRLPRYKKAPRGGLLKAW